MRRYDVELTRAAARALDRLTARDFASVERRISGLAGDPRPPGAAKLKGRAEYKLRVGRFRIVDSYDDRLVVLVVAVDDRKQVYQRLRRR